MKFVNVNGDVISFIVVSAGFPERTRPCAGDGARLTNFDRIFGSKIPCGEGAAGHARVLQTKETKTIYHDRYPTTVAGSTPN